MTEEKFREWLQAQADAAGSQRALAKRIGFSTTHLCQVLNGKRQPSQKFLRAVGLTRQMVYRKFP